MPKRSILIGFAGIVIILSILGLAAFPVCLSVAASWSIPHVSFCQAQKRSQKLLGGGYLVYQVDFDKTKCKSMIA